MQYLLTREELDNLVPKEEVQRRDIALEESGRLILELSNFKCIHKKVELKSPIHSGRSHNGYCDAAAVRVERGGVEPELDNDVNTGDDAP